MNDQKTTLLYKYNTLLEEIKSYVQDENIPIEDRYDIIKQTEEGNSEMSSSLKYINDDGYIHEDKEWFLNHDNHQGDIVYISDVIASYEDKIHDMQSFDVDKTLIQEENKNIIRILNYYIPRFIQRIIYDW